MYLLSPSEYSRAAAAAAHTTLDKVYPFSIAEGLQSGEIFADCAEHPRAYLFWHACGFGFPVGEISKEFLGEIVCVMKNPEACRAHSGRLALEAECNTAMEAFLLSDGTIQKAEQYQFAFVGADTKKSLADTEIVPMDTENYEHIKGRIVPSFSWDSKAQFLQNGFGFCLFHAGEFAACAFSAGISHQEVDIGVETAEQFRGMGCGKRVVARMIAEILRRGQTPCWQCHTQNEASMRLALSQGFVLKQKHPLYLLRSS